MLNDAWVTVLGVLLTFALLVQFASFLSDIDRDAPPATSFLAVHRRRLVEVLVDFALICAAFLAAYLLSVDGKGTVNQRFIFTSALPIVAARYLTFIPFGLYRGVAGRGRGRRGGPRRGRGVGVRRRSACSRCSATSATSRAASSSSTR